MGSPLAPILANIFMRNFEEKAFNNFTGTHPKFYRRYVDDSFLLFQDKSEVQPIFQYLNSCHENVRFTKDEESLTENFFPFLDVKVVKEWGVS